MRFRTQRFSTQLLVLVAWVAFAAVFSTTKGNHWFWLMPVVLLMFLPRSWRQTIVVVDGVGIFEGDSIVLEWEQVESLDKRGWTRAIFGLKTGGKKSVYTFDWPSHHTSEFYSLVKDRGL